MVKEIYINNYDEDLQKKFQALKNATLGFLDQTHDLELSRFGSLKSR